MEPANYIKKIERGTLFTLIIGLVFSKAILSMSIGLLVVLYLIQPNRLHRISALKGNRIFLWLSLFVALHFIGLLWTSDFNYAWKDISNKIILFVLPAALITIPLNDKEQHRFVLFFILLMLLSSGFNLLSYFQLIGHNTYDDIRGLSLFGSHIRYALLVVIACSALAHLIRNHVVNTVFGLLIITYFLGYTVYSQVITGVIAALVFLGVEITRMLYKKVGTWKTALLLSGVLVGVLVGFYLIPDQQSQELPIRKYTSAGNLYTHEYKRGYVEGGMNYLTNVCYEELVPSWNKRSAIAFDSVDIKGQPMSQTILRYMTAKGLYKDALGIKKLSNADIRSIEAGNTNPNSGIIARLKDLRFQWEHLSNPNGHSLLQRFEYWKTAWYIIEHHWLFGVGTGDVQLAFDHAYIQTKSKLKPENRFRAHNYFLTCWITFGLSGIFVFIGLLYTLIKQQFMERNYFGLTFVLIMSAGMLIEDTPETLVGISIFAFFIGLISKRTNSF